MSRSRRATKLSPLLFGLALAQGCGRCSSKKTEPDAAPTVPAPTVVAKEELLPPPAPWTFKPARVGPGSPGVALPSGCRLRGPLLRARVAPSTRFIAAPSATGALVVADVDTSETPPRLVGVAGLLLDAEGTSKAPAPLPWQEAAAMPRMARSTDGAWLAAYAEHGEGKLSSIFVYQGNTVTPLGEGDRFEPVDMMCGASRCALLTSRLGSVAAAGADVWLGAPNEPVSSWRKLEIVPAAGDSDARPSCLARAGPAPSLADAAAPEGAGVVAVLFEREELVFWQVGGEGGAREIGRVPAPHGMVDATAAEGSAGSPAPVALVYGGPVDDEGCAREGGRLHFVRPGKEPIEVRTQAPPLSGALRPLTRGTFASYLAPLGCGIERKVVYAVVLDPDGAPISAPMPVSDASSFAVAAHGEDVDIWVQLGEEVTWVRASCDPGR